MEGNSETHPEGMQARSKASRDADRSRLVEAFGSAASALGLATLQTRDALAASGLPHSSAGGAGSRPSRTRSTNSPRDEMPSFR